MKTSDSQTKTYLGGVSSEIPQYFINGEWTRVCGEINLPGK